METALEKACMRDPTLSDLAGLPKALLPIDGKLKIWRIEDFKEVELPTTQHGRFYSGDSYIVHFSYVKPGSTMVTFSPAAIEVASDDERLYRLALPRAAKEWPGASECAPPERSV